MADVITTGTMPAAQDGGDPGDEAQEGPVTPAIARLLEFVNHQNVAELIDANELGSIGQEARREYDIDKNSRSDWEKANRTAMDLAMQVTQDKNFPWAGAANVKFPLLTTAAVQFQARAYPAIVPGKEIAKAEVVGADPDGQKRERAKRVGQHMSYQLTKQIKNWEEDTDRMLVVLPIEGTCFRKTYFDPRLGRPCSELVRAMDFVVHYKAKGLDVAPRATHEFQLYPHTITERQRAGVYLDVDLGKANSSESDKDAPHDILEQHRLWDLDGDGYPEPYVVTVHKDSAKVLRIVAAYDLDGIFTAAGSVGEILKKTVGAAQSVGLDPRAAAQAVLPHLVGAEVIRIEKSSYFTKYGFIPNPESAIYDLGFGMLLNPINETVNTVLNQLLDAGTLANTGGGFIGSGVRMKSGSFKFAPGEYKRVDATGADLKSNIVPLQFNQPSPVLFQLLGLLIDAGRDIASVKDILTGEQQQANVPATTTLALIEQGLKVFSAIYKRIHRSLGEELTKLFKINRRYLNPEEYFSILDGDPQKVTLADYNEADYDVCPYSDPSISTDAQRLARAQAAVQFVGAPWSNPVEIMKRYYEAIGEENPEALFAPPPKGPSPEQLEALAELEIKRNESHAKILSMMVDNIAKLAQAESAEVGQQFGLYLEYLKVMSAQESNAANGGRSRGMAGQPGNGAGPQVPAGLPGALPAGAGGNPGAGVPGRMGQGEAGGDAPQAM